MAFAIVLALVVASVPFQFLTPWWSTPVAINRGGVDDLIDITTVIIEGTFVAIDLVTVYAAVRYCRGATANRIAHSAQCRVLRGTAPCDDCSCGPSFSACEILSNQLGRRLWP
jgi:hypothetical protein